jgi:hypothetical protein
VSATEKTSASPDDSAVTIILPELPMALTAFSARLKRTRAILSWSKRAAP